MPHCRDFYPLVICAQFRGRNQSSSRERQNWEPSASSYHCTHFSEWSRPSGSSWSGSFPDGISASAACPAGQTPFYYTSRKASLPFIGSYCQLQIQHLQTHIIMNFTCVFPVEGLFPTLDYFFLVFELKNHIDPGFHRRPENSVYPSSIS